MTKTELQNYLQQPYDQYNFATRVLKSIFQNRFEVYSIPQNVSPAPTQSERTTIERVQEYGKITLDDGATITCYEITLQPQVRIEQSRVAIQQYIRKLTFTGSGALINFISPKTPNTWRLTYIAKDSIITEKGVKTKTTNAKRYTYLLGKDESCKTAAERLHELGNKPIIDIEALTYAFSVEKLSKAFFDEYKNHYDKFVAYLDKSNFKKSVFKGDEKAIRDFCKKLLGRIVFLYFVQKKGWLGATDTEYTDGNRDFIAHLFDSAKVGDAFYATWLSNLFFDTLNNEKRKNDDFEMPTGEKLKVPFLNGGLFEKEAHDESTLAIKADLFRASNPFDVELPNKRGFLDFLNAYNFTIHEDSPDDHTVAVDPEMLGHIFENLLEDNKDKGAFYTPKEIVQYMCRESLAEYLATQCPTIAREAIDTLIKQHETALPAQDLHAIDAKLDTVKICDPAIGSGAFPMGLLHEIFSLKELIAYQVGKEWKPAEVKANIIQNCIYGVDIEKGAVDIARLRFWLSLIVDEPKPKALPNLDYKIVVGNSLVSKYGDEIVEIDWDNKKSSSSSKEFVKNIQSLLKDIAKNQKDYFLANTSQKKDKFKKDIRALKIELLINQITLNKIKYEYATPKHGGFLLSKKEATANAQREEQINKFDKLLQKLQGLKKNNDKELDFFEWKLDFPDILNPNLVEKELGFDIVIGNPPYVQLQKMKKEQPMLEKQNFLTYTRMGDLYTLFYEKGNQLLKTGGLVALITSNKWMRAGYGESLRKYFIENTKPLQLIDMGAGVFASATVDTNILLFRKGVSTSGLKLRAATYTKTDLSLPAFFAQNAVTIQHLTADAWNIADDSTQRIKAQIEAVGKPLKEWDINIYRGVTTGFNDAFVIDEATKNELIRQDAKSAEIIKPLLRGRDIKKYSYEISNLYIINTHNGELVDVKNDKQVDFAGKRIFRNNVWETVANLEKTSRKNTYRINRIDVNLYPAIQKHLSHFEKELEKRQDKGEHWSNLRNCVYLEEFEKEKIVFSKASQEKSFALDTNNHYLQNTSYCITGKNLKYLTAVLNSKLALYAFLNFYQSGGIAGEITVQAIEQIPIPQISPEAQKPFEALVDYILWLKAHGGLLTSASDKVMAGYFESVIDSAVFELYFDAQMKEAEKDVLQFLDNLPTITGKIEAEALDTVRKIYSTVSHRDHPVAQRTYYVDSVPVVRVIKGLSIPSNVKIL